MGGVEVGGVDSLQSVKWTSSPSLSCHRTGREKCDENHN